MTFTLAAGARAVTVRVGLSRVDLAGARRALREARPAFRKEFTDEVTTGLPVLVLHL